MITILFMSMLGDMNNALLYSIEPVSSQLSLWLVQYCKGDKYGQVFHIKYVQIFSVSLIGTNQCYKADSSI